MGLAKNLRISSYQLGLISYSLGDDLLSQEDRQAIYDVMQLLKKVANTVEVNEGNSTDDLTV